ncbi:MAG: hypothetical protein EXR30_01525 [Betaproteobacteria bacterium]|nr:hypothetical protein [Betaproteobacteria bacterium]
MKRRVFLAAVAALLAQTAQAHSPYRQWGVMRQRYLLVHSTRSDPRGDEIAEQLVTLLQRVLPEANAMVGRSPDQQRVASLLTTGQAVLAVMRSEDVRDLFLSQGAFNAYHGANLRRLVRVEDRVLATVKDFPAHHAWLLAAALVENPGALSIQVPDSIQGEAPVHPGAAGFARGEPLTAFR